MSVRPVPERLREPLRAEIQDLGQDINLDARDILEAAILRVTANVLTDASTTQLAAGGRMREFFNTAIKKAMSDIGTDRIEDVAKQSAIAALDSAFRKTAAEMSLDTTPEIGAADYAWAEPLGVLTTDHVGYLSFDLARLQASTQIILARAIAARQAGETKPADIAIRLQPFGSKRTINAFEQARFSSDAVVARMEVDASNIPNSISDMGPRALQKPSLTDWRLSPASFAASPQLLLGEDGCEEIVPSNLALDEFVLRQVVRLTSAPEEFALPAGVKAAYIDEYKVSWFSLGHSLGEILYSLPLAPGETVRLAVIDWSWDSNTRRDESTALTEDILHQTHRDRTIVETVKAGLKEVQHGSSFMGGLAGSGGATVGANLGAVGIGGAAGHAFSLGGSTATSEGSRDLAAENVQRLNDSFAQASSARRELNSTVVIQARQQEKESIQTRTFSNYNHSHTLTILYYEVLRHFRVTVQWVRRRRAVLVSLPMTLPTILNAQVLSLRRYLLEPFVRDKRLQPAFDALDRLRLGEAKLSRAIDKWGTSTQTVDLGMKIFVKLIAQFTTTDDDTSEPVFVSLVLEDGRTYEFQCDDAGGEGTSSEYEKALPVAVLWKEIRGIEVKLKDINTGGDWQETNILITMVTPDGERVNILADGATRTLDDDGGSTGVLMSRKPPPATTSTIGDKPRRADFVAVEDDLATQTLIAHVEAHRAYYNAVAMLGADSTTIATIFEKVNSWGPGGTMADHVDPAPLDVFGSYAAFALVNQGSSVDDSVVVDIAAALDGSDPDRRQWAQERLVAMSDGDRLSVLERLPLASARSERLNTLPTRGVFAEGKLGHCSISEEIDNTRFWKWDEHPIPIEAPEIGPVTPITPAPQQTVTSPTAFPQSLVNIVNPSSAPDPQGLTAALALLGTSNIFRDMSGRAEVADLLKKLSDNSVSIAEAANRAREIQAKYGTELDKQQKDYDLGVTQSGAATEGKKIEANAQVEAAKARSAGAQADRAEADAKKATVDAANQQAEAAKNVPKPYRAPIYADAAAALSGNPTKTKVVVFKAKGFDGQDISGIFSLFVHEVGSTPIINGERLEAYGAKSVTFSTATPVINARVHREAFILKIGDIDMSQPAISVSNDGNSYEVGKGHKTIDIILKQASRDVAFKAKSTNSAVDELMNKWGLALGVEKVVATKMVADFEKKNKIDHATEEEKSYSFNVPTQNYQMTIASH